MNRDPDLEVSRIIEWATTCITFRCLPRSGGLLDQDSYHVYALQAVYEAMEERKQLDYKRSIPKMKGK